MMDYAVTSILAAEPIDLESAKTHLRTIAGDTSEDDLITGLITAARQYCENITGRALVSQRIKAYTPALAGVMHLPRPDVTAIEQIKWTGVDGTAHVMPETDYTLLGGVLIVYKIPDAQMSATMPIEITYTAGYTAEQCPELVRTAIKLLIGHWYMNRESVQTGAVTAVEIEQTTRAILKQYRVWWF